MNRIWTLAAVLVAIVLGGCGEQKVPDGTVLSVFYSSETRGKIEGCGCKKNGGGISKRSAKLEAARAEDPNVIYCDAGNFLSGTPEVNSSEGKIIVQAYDLMGATAVNVSERELALGLDVFKQCRKDATFNFVSANVRFDGSLIADQYVIKKIKGARVAFVGLCGTLDVMRIDSTKLPAGATIDDPMTAARLLLPGLNEKSDLLFVLSTCGDQTDSLIAKEFPFVNAVIGGRSFRANEDSPWQIGDSRIVRAQRDGRTMGRLDFQFGQDNKISRVVSSKINMETSDPTDDKMVGLIRQFVPNFVDNPQDGVRIKSAGDTPHG
ncbi:MAG: hypothetical protein H6506_03285 [Calditrichaeota bacterium]|nr:hypothetical protein [Calditrichota bacterium]MCB9366270.1 hypothetical protein [Calditrichota bacterium]MCB9391660.1 hypothetical protein [Calditrichota bacterium]